ncbi:MAG: VWA domain-containing protein [Alphaproteobacteria bacterium]|nr:VWA domain-containing protein [Alphaproteobacteria bacterium]
MAGDRKLPTTPGGNRSAAGEVDAFLRRVAAMPVVRPAAGRGRLMFALDATASREPTWDRACQLQGEMFQEAGALGGLDIQLVYYRGFGEFKASRWYSDAVALLGRMTGVGCLGGQTQIEAMLTHAIAETRRQRVNALVFVGDAFEEDVDGVSRLAGELGVLGVPAFLFHEGDDAVASRAFRQIARLTGGAYCRFDANSAQQLRDLLRAVAAFAAGGRRALEDLSRRKGGVAATLASQLKALPYKG